MEGGPNNGIPGPSDRAQSPCSDDLVRRRQNDGPTVLRAVPDGENYPNHGGDRNDERDQRIDLIRALVDQAQEENTQEAPIREGGDREAQFDDRVVLLLKKAREEDEDDPPDECEDSRSAQGAFGAHRATLDALVEVEHR